MLLALVAAPGPGGGVAIVRRAAQIPDQAQGLEGFVNAANALIGPALVAMAAVAPLGCVVGAGALMFGSRRGHGDHRRLAGDADLPRLGQGHRRLSRCARCSARRLRPDAAARARSRWTAWLRGRPVVAARRRSAAPTAARAMPPVPIGAGWAAALGAGVDAITGGLGGAAVDGFGALLEELFAWPAKIDQPAAAGVAGRGPRLRDRAAGDGARAAAGSNLAELAATTSAMAFARWRRSARWRACATGRPA